LDKTALHHASTPLALHPAPTAPGSLPIEVTLPPALDTQADRAITAATQTHADQPIDSPAPRVIALMNQKGGVGKTTTTVNLGAALAQIGQRVLLIDLDPQAHLTLHLGLDADNLDNTVYHLLIDPSLPAPDTVREVSQNLDVIPAEVNLAGIESELISLAAAGQAQRILQAKCQALLDAQSGYDYILIDCPPSLGLLTINALALAMEVIVPMQAHFLALQGLSKLLETVNLVKQAINPDLSVAGTIICMHESHTVLANEVLTDLRDFLNQARHTDVPWQDAVVFEPPIRRNIKLAESPGFGKTIFDYAPACAGAHDYRALAHALEHQRATRADTDPK